MKRKYILAQKNTPWGVEINKMTGNMFSLFVSFDNETLKEEFITKYLFNGENWKNKLKNTPEKTFNLTTAMNCNFTINVVEHLKNMNIENTIENQYKYRQEMMNYDCMIMQDENGKITLWNIMCTENDGGNISYDGYFDISFNRDIRKIFKEKAQVKMIRSHINRVNKINDNFIPNIHPNSDAYYAEEFDNTINDNCFIPNINEIEIIDNDYSEYITSKNDDHIKIIKETLKTATYYLVILKNVKAKEWKQDNGTIFTHTIPIEDDKKICLFDNISTKYASLSSLQKINTKSNISSPYYSFIIPSFNYQLKNDKLNNITSSNNHNIIISQLTKLDTTLKISAIPYSFNYDDFDFDYNEKNKNIIINYKNSKYKTLAITETFKETGNEYGTILGKFLVPETSSINSKIRKEFNLYDFEYNNDINDKFILNNETKLLINKYYNVLIKGNEETNFSIFVEWFKNNKLELRKIINNDPNFQQVIIIPSEKNNNENIYKDDNLLTLNLKYQDINNYQLYLETDVYLQKLVGNSNQLNLQERLNKRNAELDRYTTTISLMSAMQGMGGNNGISQVIGGNQIAGSISSFIKSNDNIKTFSANIKDLKSIPNQIKGNGNNLLNLLNLEQNNYFLIKYTLIENLKKLIGQHFNIYGYSLSGIHNEPNKYLNNRYHRQYFQCESIFENFQDDISIEERQYWVKSLANGIEIYYYRDHDTFKGFKNYDTNNVEMEFIDKKYKLKE